MREISHGQCLYGALKYELKGHPSWISHCHCLSCRRNTGCAVVTFVGYPAEKVTFVQGERAIYNSSLGVWRGFCSKCGTPISYEADRYPGEIHLYISALDNPDDFAPQQHVHFNEKIEWFDTNDDLPRKESSG